MQTVIEPDFRVAVPEALRSEFWVGEQLIVSMDVVGRLMLMPKHRILTALEQTAGMWRDHQGVSSDGVVYVNELRQGRRLQQQSQADEAT